MTRTRLLHPQHSIARRATGVTVLVLTVLAAAGTFFQSAPPVSAQIGIPPISLQPLPADARVHAGTTVRTVLRIDVPATLHIQAHQPSEPTVIPTVLTFDDHPDIRVTEVVYPPSTTVTVLGYAQPLDVYEGILRVGVTMAFAPTLPPGPVTLRAQLRYQACDDSQCYFPRTVDTRWSFDVVAADQPASDVPPETGGIAFGTGAPPTVAALAEPAPAMSPARSSDEALLALFDEFEILTPQAGSYMDEAEFLEFLDNAENGVSPAGLFDNRGPLAILLLVFVGGLALNLTPCVLPMIPINLMIIGAGSQSASRGRGFLLGLTYGAAMAAVYGAIGLVVILTAGTFGTINASPWFNFGVAALFVVLGLAMFDIVTIDFSRFSSRITFGAHNRGTFMLAFGMGAVSALLAGACVAPVVIQVVVFASEQYAGGAGAALALPFVLGLGMALPWPIAGAGFSTLPRPGAWMVRVKHTMGVFILAMAAYYGYVGYQILSSRWVDPASVQASVDRMLASGWHASLADGLEQARRDRTPVLVDFWATWCKNCLVMDRTTLASDAVLARLNDYTKIKFQAEDPTTSPTRQLMQRIDAIGLPAYVVLRYP
jgi:thioredoxin:protein disulfide reductase